jgi:hypothetical protein
MGSHVRYRLELERQPKGVGAPGVRLSQPVTRGCATARRCNTLLIDLAARMQDRPFSPWAGKLHG